MESLPFSEALDADRKDCRLLPAGLGVFLENKTAVLTCFGKIQRLSFYLNVMASEYVLGPMDCLFYFWGQKERPPVSYSESLKRDN